MSILLGAVLLAAQSADRITLAPPSADSYLHEQPADKNCNNHDRVMISAWDGRPGEHRTTVLRFHLWELQDRSEIKSARLEFKVIKSHGTPVPVKVVRLDRPWRLRDATWAFGFKGKSFGTSEVVVRDGWHSYDVTEVVRSWQSGSPNHGVMLSVPSDARTRCQLIYGSSRAKSREDVPRLVVEAGPISFPVGPLKPVPAARQRPEWTRHALLVWQRKTDVRKDAALYEELGLHGFHIDHGAGREDYVRLSNEKKWPYYVDHAAGKGILHLTDASREQISRKRAVVVRPNSLADPKNIAVLKDSLRRNVPPTKNGLVYAYAFDDEISLGLFNSPSEVDGHLRSVAWYRAWLRDRYGSIEELNRRWAAAYTSFAEVVPVSFEEVRLPHRSPPLRSWNLARWMEWRHFMDYQFAHVLGDLTRYTNALAPGIPAGFVGGQSPSAYGGYDYSLLCRSVQWMEAYDINGTAEILRSFWSRPRRIRMQTFFTRDDYYRNSWLLWYRLAAGHQANIAWPEDWFANDASGKRGPTDRVKPLAPVFREVQGPVSEFVTHPDSELSIDPIGIYYSHPSIRASWAMDAITHKKTWVSRSSSLESGNSSSGYLRVSWCKLLEDLGYQYRYVSSLDVHEGRGQPLKGLKVLIMPRILCVSDKEAAALRAFVAEGGTLIADSLCGVLTRVGKGRPRGALDDLFGIARDETVGYLNGKTLVEIDAERGKLPFEGRLQAYEGALGRRGLVVYERGTKARGAEASETVGSADVLIRKGKAVYLNLTPTAYRHFPIRSGAVGREWRRVVADRLREAGVLPRVRVRENGNEHPFIESLMWERGNAVCLVLVKNYAYQADMFGQGSIRGQGQKPKESEIEVSLSFQARNLRNLRTGRSFGAARAFKDRFKPWEANLYLFDR